MCLCFANTKHEGTACGKKGMHWLAAASEGRITRGQKLHVRHVVMTPPPRQSSKEDSVAVDARVTRSSSRRLLH